MRISFALALVAVFASLVFAIAAPVFAHAPPDHVTHVRPILLAAIELPPATPPAALPDPGAGDGGWAVAVLNAYHGHQLLLLAALLMIGAIYVLRKGLTWLPGKVGAFFGTDRGGALITLAIGVLGALALSLASNRFNSQIFAVGLTAAMTAAGGFNLIKRIFAPSDKAPAGAAAVAK